MNTQCKHQSKLKRKPTCICNVSSTSQQYSILLVSPNSCISGYFMQDMSLADFFPFPDVLSKWTLLHMDAQLLQFPPPPWLMASPPSLPYASLSFSSAKKVVLCPWQNTNIRSQQLHAHPGFLQSYHLVSFIWQKRSRVQLRKKINQNNQRKRL